jgi:hypothetical protein
MNEYVRYRNWWQQHQYESFYYTEAFEVAFAEHVNSMTLYELMETLEGWSEEDRLKAVPDFSEDDAAEQHNKLVEEASKNLDHVCGVKE